MWTKFIYIKDLDTLLQLLIENKAYYLEIKVGLPQTSSKIPIRHPHHAEIFFQLGDFRIPAVADERTRLGPTLYGEESANSAIVTFTMGTNLIFAIRFFIQSAYYLFLGHFMSTDLDGYILANS